MRATRPFRALPDRLRARRPRIARDAPAGKMLKAPKLAGNTKVAGMAVADILKAVKENEKHKGMLKKLSDAQIEAGATRAKAFAEAQ